MYLLCIINFTHEYCWKKDPIQRASTPRSISNAYTSSESISYTNTTIYTIRYVLTYLKESNHRFFVCIFCIPLPYRFVNLHPSYI